MLTKSLTIFLLTSLLSLSSCKTRPPTLYTWGHFNIEAANEFVAMADNLKNLNSISIFDTREFKVNNQSIFLDTTLIDQPNYYNYKKRANEIGVDATSLLKALKTFYRMGVNEYRQKENYYLFPVVTGMFSIERGYLFTRITEVSQGDTILTKQGGGEEYKLILVKKVDANWFEYIEAE